MYLRRNNLGQTIGKVGVLLHTSQCFAHGQLYVALSRVRSADNIRVCTCNQQRLVTNIVIKELLDPEDIDAANNLPKDGGDVISQSCTFLSFLFSFLANLLHLKNLMMAVMIQIPTCYRQSLSLLLLHQKMSNSLLVQHDLIL